MASCNGVKVSGLKLIMADTIIDKAWSSIQVGDFVRWATPVFVKYGHVTRTPGGRTMVFKFIDDANERVLPDARYYFVEGKRSADAEEHLVCVDYKYWYEGGEVGWTPLPDEHPMSSNAWITVEAACEMLNWEAKKLRRYIRKGVILAHKRDDRWKINAERLKAQAAKSGWI